MQSTAHPLPLQPRAAGASEPAYLAGPPLFWRLMAANMVVVLGGAVVGTALTQQFVVRGVFTPLTHTLMVVAALVLSGVLTAVILHLAFRPLRALRAAIDASPASGRRPAAPPTPDRYGDPDIVAVAQAVHGLWDRLDQHVRLLEQSNQTLDRQRSDLADKTVQLERLARLVLAAQEDERRRIARELHDDTMQSLAALIMGLERLVQALPAETAPARGVHASVTGLRDLAVRTLDDLRLLALDLRPAVLDDHGLVAAVRWLIETDEPRYSLHAHLELEGAFARSGAADRRLSPPVETALFRIVQEALANAGKHAQAEHVAIRLTHQGNWVGADVADDGIGLPEGSAAPDSRPGHMGLFNMRERAALLGGTCEIGPGATGRGTEVHVRIPTAAVPVPRQ